MLLKQHGEVIIREERRKGFGGDERLHNWSVMSQPGLVVTDLWVSGKASNISVLELDYMRISNRLSKFVKGSGVCRINWLSKKIHKRHTPPTITQLQHHQISCCSALAVSLERTLWHSVIPPRIICRLRVVTSDSVCGPKLEVLLLSGGFWALHLGFRQGFYN